MSETPDTSTQEGLDARAQYPTSTLADLYDPLMMPTPLLKAHQQLDRAVDRCYRPEPLPSDRHRVEYLFALYEQITAPFGRRGQASGSDQRYERLHKILRPRRLPHATLKPPESPGIAS